MKHDPRSAKLKEKRSAPNLRTKRSAINIPASGKGRKVIKESFVPGVRSRASAPNLKQAAEELPPNPPSPPSEGPGSQTNKSNDKQDGVSQSKEIPRFMLLTETKIKPVEYRPPRQYTGPPIPKIMGIEPIFFRPKPVEIKKESRKERILKEIRKRYQVRKARVRGVVKNLRNIRALRTLHALKASVKAMRKDAQERILEVRVVKDVCCVVETADHAASTAKSDQDNTSSFEYVSPKALSQDTNTNEDTPRHASHETCIPAPAYQKVGAGGNQRKGARVTSEHRSSIPVAVRKVGTEHQNMPEGGSIGHEAAKTHATESTRRPHVSPFQHQIDTLWGFIPDEDIANEVSRYSSTSSPSSDWDGDQVDADELERPSGYTGDNLRPFERSAQRFYGPRLQIAASAENVIMGTPKLSSRSSPDLKRDVPRTATQSSPHNARLGEQGSRSVEGGQEAKVSPAGTPEAFRNFCRPRPSLENNSRRDFSGRDLSIPRKPVGSPSLIDLHNPSLNDLPSQYVVPTVPKLPDGHNAFLRKDKPLPELKAARVKGAAAASGPHPTQTSSLQSVPASHGESAVTTPRTPNISNPGGTTDLEHTVTFDHIVLENKHSAQRGKGKFPDSRSNRMLDSFRNIFKHKNAADKARIKNEESTDAAVEESAVQAQSGAADRACKDDGKVESATTASKSRIRSPRLPERAGWSKGARSISAPIHVSPGAFPTPTSSLSSIPAPSPRVYEEYQTPSFARPTKSTRTRAATNLRLQTPVAADSRFRRTSAMAASTGSPQRSTRVSRHLRSATGSKKTLQAKKIAEEHAATSESPGAASSQTTYTSNTDWLNLPQEQKDEEISAFIPRIFREICEEADRDKRAEMLRETLSLKHQLDTVNNARAVVTEAEETLRKKMEKKTVAERALYERFLQARTKVAS
ncbi:hypothetical protein LV164_006694 [Aspergillus fumigatus]|nr:hypothetical protein KXW60_007575 [Aspergillus fumigatus]KAH3199267.1 hypothetical protein KXV92_009693 [Aspergillus fumigatus]KAH3204614.1 hypothetical protein KXW62_005985 [Aspergillus fumigatus]KAJ8203421.1 hypothetical protein LV164_006694 [Aspergillus fumigatus]